MLSHPYPFNLGNTLPCRNIALMATPPMQVPVTSWFEDPNDTELRDLLPFFEALDKVDNVLTVLAQNPALRHSEEERSKEQ